MQKIGIVTVLNTTADRSRYRTAMETMECYALMHNLHIFGIECSRLQKRIMFQRHCIVATILESFEWVLFVDADIGVVNENGVLIFESSLQPMAASLRWRNSLEPDKDIIFYIRIFIHEVMAGSYLTSTAFALSSLETSINNHHIKGSYLVKRSAFSKRFLRGWADYESLLPRSFHGRDNGAIH
ncbi:hypothetical protein COOONC_17654, partial [Cooperia oncophora]